MFMDDTKAIDLKREAVLKKAFTKPCNKTAFVKVLADLQKTLPLGSADDPASSTVWAKHQKLDAHALINNANTLRWWKDVTNADFEGTWYKLQWCPCVCVCAGARARVCVCMRARARVCLSPPIWVCT